MAGTPVPMHSRARAARTRRLILGTLLAIAAINAFGGGWYGMAGAGGMPVEWLIGTPFKDYFIPSLILFIVVGGAFLAAAIACFIGHPFARTLAFVSIIIVIIWLTAQILLIGYVSWLQPATAIYAVLLLVLTLSWSDPIGYRQAG